MTRLKQIRKLPRQATPVGEPTVLHDGAQISTWQLNGERIFQVVDRTETVRTVYEVKPSPVAGMTQVARQRRRKDA